MAGNSRSPYGGGPAARAGASLFEDDEERTTIDPGGAPLKPPVGWGEPETTDGRSQRAAGKVRSDDDDADTQSATLDEYTVEESARPVRDMIRRSMQAAAGRLQITAGNDKGKSIELTGRRVTIGRGIDNDVVLTDLAVSRHHLVIECDRGRYFILDQGSGNGTLLNDVEQRDKCDLSNGDRLEVGNTIIAVDLPNQAAAIPNEKTMDLGDDDLAQLHGSDEQSDEISTYAGRKDVRRLVGAGVAKAKAQRAKVQAKSVASHQQAGIAARVTQKPMNAAAVRPANLNPAPAHIPAPPVPNIPGPAPIAAAPRVLGAPGHRADPSLPLPRPGSTAPAQPSWSNSSAALPVRGAASSGAVAKPRNPTAPVVYGDDRLPIRQASGQAMGQRMGQPMGPAITAQGADAIPKLAPGHAGSAASRRSKTRILIGVGGALAATMIVAVVAFAASGDGDAKASGDDQEEVDNKTGDKASAAAGDKDGDKEAKAIAAADKDGDKDGDKDTAAADKDSDKDGDKDIAAADKDGDKDGDDTIKLVAALPVSTWGTDETQLAAGFKFKDDPETAKTEGDPDGQVDPKDGTPDDGAPVVVDDPPPKRTEPPKKTRKPPTRVVKRDRRPKKVVPRVRTPKKVATPKSSGASSKDKARAAALYKARKFDQAASLLRASAKKASGSEAKKMARLASLYASVGSNLNKGNSSRSNPPVAVAAYSKAFSSDKSAGGAHAGVLRANIKLLAPSAAKSAMARREYTKAKRMADIASRFGAGTKVSSVRASLEKQAKALVAAARRDAKSGKKSAAKKKYKTAKGIVPKSSSNYRAAVAGLRTL